MRNIKKSIGTTQGIYSNLDLKLEELEETLQQIQFHERSNDFQINLFPLKDDIK